VARKKAHIDAVKLETLVVEYVPPDSIEPNEYNPNRQSEYEFELLCRSMGEDGFTQPIIVMRSTRKIVDGEHRWRAARKLGYEAVPVVFVDMTEAQRRIATLRHNRARGSEDVELSAAVLRDLRALGVLEDAAEALMLDEVEITVLLDETPESELFIEEPPADLGPDAALPSDGSGVVTASSGALRERETQLREQREGEERSMSHKDGALLRVIATFAGDEAEVIRRVFPAPVAGRLVAAARYLDGNQEALDAVRAAAEEDLVDE
jgi:ParB/RepB/Spo0J family partition protein